MMLYKPLKLDIMKRMMTAALIAVMGAITVLAQEVQVKKPRLLIENFGCASGLSTAVRDQVRMNVISAINDSYKSCSHHSLHNIQF